MSEDRTTNGHTAPGTHLSDATLNDFASGRLDEAARASVLRHAAACPECAGALRDYTALRGALGSLPAPRLRRSFQLSEEQARVKVRRRLPTLASALPALRAATIAVALLLLVVAGVDRLTAPGGKAPSNANFAAMAAPTQTATSVAINSVSDGAANTTPTQASLGETSGAESRSETSQAASAIAPAPASGSLNAGSASEGAAPSNAAAKIALPPEATPASSPSVAPTTAPSPSPTPIATPAVAIAAASSGSDRMGWRVAELGLGLLLLWLLVSYVGAWQSSRSRI